MMDSDQDFYDAVRDDEGPISSLRLSDLDTVSPRWKGASYEMVAIYLERLYLTGMDDNQLPLFVNNDWISIDNKEYYMERLANAGFSRSKD